jgi:hypothetical protein
MVHRYALPAAPRPPPPHPTPPRNTGRTRRPHNESPPSHFGSYSPIPPLPLACSLALSLSLPPGAVPPRHPRLGCVFFHIYSLYACNSVRYLICTPKACLFVTRASRVQTSKFRYLSFLQIPFQIPCAFERRRQGQEIRPPSSPSAAVKTHDGQRPTAGRPLFPNRRPPFRKRWSIPCVPYHHLISDRLSCSASSVPPLLVCLAVPHGALLSAGSRAAPASSVSPQSSCTTVLLAMGGGTSQPRPLFDYPF